MIKFTRQEKIFDLKKELGYRKYLYPKQVLKGNMRPDEMAYRLAILDAIIDDYEHDEQLEQLPLGLKPK